MGPPKPTTSEILQQLAPCDRLPSHACSILQLEVDRLSASRLDFLRERRLRRDRVLQRDRRTRLEALPQGRRYITGWPLNHDPAGSDDSARLVAVVRQYVPSRGVGESCRIRQLLAVVTDRIEAD